MTIQEATFSMINQLRTIYDEGEASNITDWVMETLSGATKMKRLQNKNEKLSNENEALLETYIKRLLQHEPIQYVLNEAWFSRMKFYVDKHVLIPRPETEELIEWLISYCNSTLDELKILDVGTGSGCIPISLKSRLPKASIWSCDISSEALAVAKKNAENLQTAINFIQLDFLDKNTWKQFPTFDIIVSNPPYIPERDKATMQANVLQFEPATALFVPNNDAMVFYKAIAEFGKKNLNKGGTLFFEIHEDLGKEVTELLQTEGYSATIKKDMQEKDRMIKSGLL